MPEENPNPPGISSDPSRRKNAKPYRLAGYTAEKFNQFRQPPPHVCKKIRKGPLTLTEINIAWRKEAMTKAFGLAGVGWGSQVNNHWITTEPVIVYHVMVSVWIRPGSFHMDNESVHSVCVADRQTVGTQIGSTRVTTSNCDEAYKSAISNAQGKIFAELGVGHDIYLGLDNQPN